MSIVSPVVIITGAAAGIGRATARAFAQAGYRIVAADNQAEAGPALIAELRALGAEATFVAADQALEADGARVVQVALDTFGRLDAAVNNAGIEGVEHRIEDQDPAALRRTLAVNLEGVLWAMKHEIPALRRSGGGAIVNLSSVAGHIGFEGMSAYVASKHAVEGLTKTAALENARHGIRVNAVAPGAIQTDMIDRVVAGDPSARAALAAQHPMGRMGRAEEVAAAILFLCSPAASFITGHSLPVDGGWLAK